MHILLYICCFLLISYVYFSGIKNKTTKIKSKKFNKSFVVQNNSDKQKALLILEIIHERIMKLRKYLSDNIGMFPEYSQYIKQFINRIVNLSLQENKPDGLYTSYTVNKGQEIALCLRSKQTFKLHDINLIMYVVIHELAHVACPENDHTELFRKIFKFLLKCAIEIQIYYDKDYTVDPHEYCGIIINEYIL